MMQNKPDHKIRHKGDVVHSGHFMISSVADEQEEHEDLPRDRDSPTQHEQSIMIKHGYDFSKVQRETKNTYHFGPSNEITIDASLSRLFQCMSLAYQGGKVISPKWKNFKGMKLTVKDKIRLNNAIWRTWHIQYMLRKKKGQFLIQFTTPSNNDHSNHVRPEAVALEGVYWKRRIETLVAEYKKWRGFYLNKVIGRRESPSKESIEAEQSRVENEMLLNEFTDTLFSNLSQQSFQFPNPREIAMHATNSDMIQPGLLQLQPTVDDYMDFDSFQDLFVPPKKTPVTFSGATNQTQLDCPPETELGVTLFTHNLVQPTVIKPVPSEATGQGVVYVGQVAGDKKMQTTYSLEPPSAVDGSTFSSVNFAPVVYQQMNDHPQQQQMLDHVTTYQPVVPAQKYQSNAHNYQQQHHQVIAINPTMNPSMTISTQQPPTCSVTSFDPQPTTYYYNTKLPDATLNFDHTQQTVIVSGSVPLKQMSVDPTAMSVVEQASSQYAEVAPQPQRSEPARSKQRKRGPELVAASTDQTGIVKQKYDNHGATNSSPVRRTNPSVIPEKRRSLVEDRSAPTPGARDQLLIAPKPPLTVDMEQVTLVSSSISLPESEMSQIESMQRRGSLSTEQKRRFNIKAAFNRLQSLLPGSSEHNNTKISKASLMNKTTHYIKTMQAERVKMNEEKQSLKLEIEKLQAAISSTQSQLPATGAPLPRQRAEQGDKKFKAWVRHRTRQNWKFFLFSKVIRPWFESYHRSVSVGGVNELVQSIRIWLQEHCTLRVLRLDVIKSLQVVSTSTSILTEPSLLRQQILEEVQE